MTGAVKAQRVFIFANVTLLLDSFWGITQDLHLSFNHRWNWENISRISHFIIIVLDSHYGFCVFWLKLIVSSSSTRLLLAECKWNYLCCLILGLSLDAKLHLNAASKRNAHRDNEQLVWKPEVGGQQTTHEPNLASPVWTAYELRGSYIY